MLTWPSSMPRWSAMSWASWGCVRPVKSASFLVVIFSISVTCPARSMSAESPVRPRSAGPSVAAASVERTGVGVRFDDRSGCEVGERADRGAVTDACRRAHRVLHDGPAADPAVGETGVRAELAAGAHHRGAVEHRARVERDVTAELDGDVDERLARSEHGDACQEPVTVGARPQLALGEGELPAVVDALGLLGGRLHHADAVAHAGE